MISIFLFYTVALCFPLWQACVAFCFTPLYYVLHCGKHVLHSVFHCGKHVLHSVLHCCILFSTVASMRCILFSTVTSMCCILFYTVTSMCCILFYTVTSMCCILFYTVASMCWWFTAFLDHFPAWGTGSHSRAIPLGYSTFQTIRMQAIIHGRVKLLSQQSTRLFPHQLKTNQLLVTQFVAATNWA